MKDIVKTFGCFTANDHVNLEVRKGEIHALLGENGAGKSTLMNILYGLYRQDSGQILLNGSPVNFHGPSDAIAHNIGMVHQHFMLVQPFTVAENLILGCEPTKGLRLDLKKAHEMIRNVSDRYGLHVDPDAKISDISVGMQQRVEILKILLRDAKILIFDEPTGALTPQEIQDLFVILRKLRENGHTILIITHKLKEIKQISDRVTVIRKGQNVGTVETADTSEQQLAELMVGRKVILQTSRDKHEPGRVVLQMQNVHARNARGIEALRGLSLQVRAVEIVGIAGVEGNGQSEIALVLKRMQLPQLWPKAKPSPLAAFSACAPMPPTRRTVPQPFAMQRNFWGQSTFYTITWGLISLLRSQKPRRNNGPGSFGSTCAVCILCAGRCFP